MDLFIMKAKVKILGILAIISGISYILSWFLLIFLTFGFGGSGFLTGLFIILFMYILMYGFSEAFNKAEFELKNPPKKERKDPVYHYYDLHNIFKDPR